MNSGAKLQLFCEKRLLYQKNVVILHPQIGKIPDKQAGNSGAFCRCGTLS